MSNASAAQAIFFQNYCHLFGVSFLIWDYIITIDVESQYLWKRAKSASAYSFFAIRYGALATNIPVVVFSLVTLPNKDVTLQSTNPLHIVCADNSIRLSAPFKIFPSVLDLAGPWECLFAFDTMIFGMTAYKGYVMRRDAGGANMPIHHILVRDGAMYFAAMALANLANIVTFFIGGPLVPGSLATFATWMLSAGYAVPSMSVGMMSRLMLNLHERTDVGVLTELRMSGINGELAFAETESLPLTEAEGSRRGSG
ncbi:hypothetical protein B0H19DRAFT_1275218 [Mycena capillaripes]|nr:hypothetical protein B0H19DRAFT_1275218 [Mycena capillaripes]